MPDPHLVLRRNFDVADTIKPWLISDAYTSPEMQAWIDRECGGQQQALVLQRPRSLRGVKFSDLLTLEIDVDVPDRFPFPRPGSGEEPIGRSGAPNEFAAAPTGCTQIQHR